MPTPPTPQQRKKLRDALISAFPERSSLEQLLYFELDKNLNQITKDSNLNVIVFELIRTAESEGWLVDLIDAARKSNPGNTKLCDVAKELTQNHLELPSISSLNIHSSLSGNSGKFIIETQDYSSIKLREITVNLREQKLLLQDSNVKILTEISKTYKHLDAIRNNLIALLVEQDKIKQETIIIINFELKKYWNLIMKIDYDVPELRQFMQTNSILDEKFSAGIPKDIEAQMTQCLKYFDANPTSQNLDQLLDAYSSLVQLNKDFWWVIHELCDKVSVKSW